MVVYLLLQILGVCQPALRSEEPGCASPKALSCFCVLGCWDRPAGQCRGFLCYLCLASSVTLPGEISSSARCLNWRGAEGPPCPCGVRGGLLQPPAPAAASPPELFLFLEKCKSRPAVPREEAAPAGAVCGEGKFKAFRNPEGTLLRVMPGPAPPRQPAGKDAYPAAGREGLVLADSVLATEQEAFIFLWAQLRGCFSPRYT